MDLNTPNLTGLLQSRQNPPDVANRCFDAFGYISLGSEVMHLKIAQHPIAKRSGGELMHSWASRSTPASWRMFGIGNGLEKDSVEGVNFVGHGLRALKRLRNERPYEEIDPAIKPLVDALNRIKGIKTVASCQGHFFGGTPYVYFNAPVRIAAAIERLLRTAMTADQPKFMLGWSIEGMFNEKYELTFSIRAAYCDASAWSPLYAFWLFVLRRKRLNADFLMLSEYLREKAGHLNKRPSHEPNIRPDGDKRDER